MTWTMAIGRSCVIRGGEAILGIAASLLGLATIMNLLPDQVNLVYGTSSSFYSSNPFALMATTGTILWPIVGISVLLNFVAIMAGYHTISHAIWSRVMLLVATCGLVALTAVTFLASMPSLDISVLLAIGATALSFSWR